MAFDKSCTLSATTQGLKPERTSPGEKVDRMQLIDSGPYKIEDCLPNAIFHRSRHWVTMVADFVSAKLSPHNPEWYLSGSCRSSPFVSVGGRHRAYSLC